MSVKLNNYKDINKQIVVTLVQMMENLSECVFHGKYAYRGTLNKYEPNLF
jgi:hypothetical protein